ncbi:MAG: alpha-L-rhamnosidase, partial [Bacteroidetes bacterium]|nr:alpha-L-rhamnosidase [Bacteroidota bacterium]
YAMPLVVGLVKADDKTAVYQNLIAAIERDGYALTAGDVGFHYLVRALQDFGAHEVIWRMNARDDVPGYGYQLRKGATALTESWPALRYVSNNHMMLGHLMEWLFSGIGGIRQAEGSIGYEQIIIDPQAVGDLSWAEVSHTCIRGEIYMRWEKKGKGIRMEIIVPEGSTAELSFGGKFIGSYNAGKHIIKKLR